MLRTVLSKHYTEIQQVVKPYDLIFRDLKQSEAALKNLEER